MVDPQGQANRWIKKMGQPQHIVVCKFTDGDYLKRLEGCIQFGHPMLIENILEETDPAVEPVLLRQTFKKGNTVMIKLGEAIVEYQKDFKFFLTTKLRNPHYLPEVAVKVTVLNFMITQVGLQDQLLNIVVEKERPDLAEEKARLVVEGAENKEQLEVTENKILDVLSSSQGNILDDESAVQVLSSSKQLSNEIAEKQKIGEETEVKIDEARLAYVPVAFKAAVLFFCVADMANIDPMYQYSLPFFINLFKAAIFKSEPSNDIDQRIAILNDFFMEMLYKNICRSLFEKHKLLFSFLLTMRLQIVEDVVSMNDYRFLLTGGVSLEEAPTKPADWLPDRAWSEMFKMGKTDEKYQVLHETFGRDRDSWREIYDSVDPLTILQNEKQQPESMKELSKFNELMVLRCLRPDRLLPGVMEYVADQIGEKFVTPPPFDIAGSYADSSNIAPLIFILSPGSDPFSALNQFAVEKGRDIQGLSLGQGQGPKAEKLLEEGSQMGFWVLLQNCHLFASWMPRMEKILEQMDPKQTAADFRLWLTSYPSDKFPVPILQSGVKITNEAPQGLRANLIGSFLLDPITSEDFFENCAAPGPFKKLLYSLCFFHAVIQERRLFGPLGWNIPYEFTQNDLRISARQLRMFIEESPDEIPFKAINYLTGECNYGGRVTEKQDRRLLMVLLADYYNPAALNEDYSLCFEHKEYVIPPPGTHEEMLEAIGNMGLVVPPGVYGFHENANLTREQNETYNTMENLLLTVGQASGGGGSSSDDTIREVADDILRRCPDPWNVARVQEKYPTMYEESMNTVLVQELNRFNGLIKVIKASLYDIQKAIKGLLLMGEDLEQVFQAIFNGKTPAMWLGSSYPSLKPLGGYTNDLMERLKFFQTWVDSGIPVLFWISGIYFTQAFTTGASQNYARKYTIPIDTLTFDFELPREQTPKEKPADGVYTYGPYLEGCKWNWQNWELDESDPKVLYVPVPMIWIVPCKKVDLRQFPSYECPMYKVSTRKGVLSTTGHSTNFVMPIRINSSHPESHWVKRGVAMLTTLDS
jgi:dynein heavy chain